jgi:hypothetical protein
LVQDLKSVEKVEFKLMPGISTGGINIGKVGSGFFDGYIALQEQFYDKMGKAIALTNCTNAERKLYITGHSLGGALAMLAAMDLRYNTQAREIWAAFDSVTVYTFEAPRAGDADFVAAFKTVTKDVWEVENYFDLIPHMPPHSAGFEHVSNLALIGPHPGEIRHMSDAANDEHTSTSHSPVYYHEEDAVIAQLNGLTGAGPAPGAPSQCDAV